VESSCQVYRPRDPRKTPLYGLLDSFFERVKGVWEERFERSYGFWRGLVDAAVARYLDCGIWERGFARVRCRDCPEEFLVALSCKARGLCPSCGAKRAAEVAAFLQDEVVEDVGHAQWVFTLPKMLRVYFLHHRELLGALSLAAYQTVKELMVAAAGEKGFRPGMVSVVQTFGDRASFHPHVRALATRGGWTASGEWIPVPYVDEGVAEELFRHKVLTMLRDKGLLRQERIDLLMSWRRSGFSVHNRVQVPAGDGQGLEALARYMMCSPISCPDCASRRDRPRSSTSTKGVMTSWTRGRGSESTRWSSSLASWCRFRARDATRPATTASTRMPPGASVGRPPRRPRPRPRASPSVRQRRRLMERTAPPSDAALAEMLRRVYEVDPLVCPRCGGEMRVVGFITEPGVIRRILDHLRKRDRPSRSPPPLRRRPVAALA
jgi:hypothetical protein